MTGKEYHKLMGLAQHFRQRAKEWREDAKHEESDFSKDMSSKLSEGKSLAYDLAGQDVEKLLEEMNS